MALNYAEPPNDAISVSIPLARLSPQRELEVVEIMRHVQDQILRVINPMKSGSAWV